MPLKWSEGDSQMVGGAAGSIRKMYAFWYAEMDGGIWRMSIKWWPDLIENKNQICQKERKLTWRSSEVHAGCFHIELEDTRTPWNWYSSSHPGSRLKSRLIFQPAIFQVRAVGFREGTLCFSKTIAIENGPIWIRRLENTWTCIFIGTWEISIAMFVQIIGRNDLHPL